MLLVPAAWMPAATMTRVITHWTAGRYAVTSGEKSHYHILIDGDSKLHRGSHTIADNESTSDGVYAAHTKGANTGAIGVTVCCMEGAVQSPFNGGSYPMKEEQWKTMAWVVAELCSFYGIAVTNTTVLGHGEVQTNLGVAQNGKWDPMKLPWDTAKSITQVGDEFRSLVTASLGLIGLIQAVKNAAASIGRAF